MTAIDLMRVRRREPVTGPAKRRAGIGSIAAQTLLIVASVVIVVSIAGWMWPTRPEGLAPG